MAGGIFASDFPRAPNRFLTPAALQYYEILLQKGFFSMGNRRADFNIASLGSGSGISSMVFGRSSPVTQILKDVERQAAREAQQRAREERQAEIAAQREVRQ